MSEGEPMSWRRGSASSSAARRAAAPTGQRRDRLLGADAGGLPGADAHPHEGRRPRAAAGRAAISTTGSRSSTRRRRRRAARARGDHRRVTDQIGVIGAGAWGTTLAIKLAAAERPVTIWAHTPERNQSWRRSARTAATCRVSFPPNIRVATEDAFLAEPHRGLPAGRSIGPPAGDAAAPGTQPGLECRAAERGQGDRGRPTAA